MHGGRLGCCAVRTVQAAAWRTGALAGVRPGTAAAAPAVCCAPAPAQLLQTRQCRSCGSQQQRVLQRPRGNAICCATKPCLAALRPLLTGCKSAHLLSPNRWWCTTCPGTARGSSSRTHSRPAAKLSARTWCLTRVAAHGAHGCPRKLCSWRWGLPLAASLPRCRRMFAAAAQADGCWRSFHCCAACCCCWLFRCLLGQRATPTRVAAWSTALTAAAPPPGLAQLLCRGFGIVRFPNKEAAELAVNTMNNATIGGRVVSVRIDRFA